MCEDLSSNPRTLINLVASATSVLLGEIGSKILRDSPDSWTSYDGKQSGQLLKRVWGARKLPQHGEESRGSFLAGHFRAGKGRE